MNRSKRIACEPPAAAVSTRPPSASFQNLALLLHSQPAKHLPKARRNRSYAVLYRPFRMNTTGHLRFPSCMLQAPVLVPRISLL